MKLEINDEMADEIVISALRDSIASLKQSIKQLNKLQERKKYQQADLDHFKTLLPQLEATYDFFGGNLK